MVLKAMRLVEIPNLEKRPKTELWDTLMFRCGDHEEVKETDNPQPVK